MHKRIYLYLIILLVIYGFWNAIQKPGTTNNQEEVLPSPPKTITLLATGDMNMGRLTGQKILEGDTNYAFEYIGDYLKGFDITFGNLESQLADLGGETQSPTNEYRFAGPPGGAEGLKYAGYDIVSTANNHMWDYGKDALFETMTNLEQAGVSYAGCTRNPEDLYKPTIITIGDQKVAFFAVTMLLNGYEKAGATEYVAWADPERLLPEIQAIEPGVDWIIVSLHGGVEYRATPIQKKVDLAHQMIDAGANVVIGHHTHIPQGVEEYNNGLIFYSLGNFSFWQPFGYWTEHSFVAEIELRPDGSVDYNPVAVKSGWQPRLIDGEDEIKVLQHIAELSEKL